MRNLQEQVKKHSITKIGSDYSLLEQIVPLISKFLQIIGLQPRIFLNSIEQFFLTVGQNHFENKIPFLKIQFSNG